MAPGDLPKGCGGLTRANRYSKHGDENMSRASKNLLFSTLFSFLGFLFFLGLGQWMIHQVHSIFWMFMSILTFYLVFPAIWGIVIPVLLARKFSFKFHRTVSRGRMANGIIILILTLYFSLFRTGDIHTLPHNIHEILTAFKFAMLFIPLAAGITLQCFFLIPRTLERIIESDPVITEINMVAASGLALGTVFYTFSLFSAPGTAFEMLILGLAIGTVSLFTGSLINVFVAIFLIADMHALTESSYYFILEPEWGPVLLCLTVTAIAWKYSFRYYLLNKDEN